MGRVHLQALVGLVPTWLGHLLLTRLSFLGDSYFDVKAILGLRLDLHNSLGILALPRNKIEGLIEGGSQDLIWNCSPGTDLLQYLDEDQGNPEMGEAELSAGLGRSHLLYNLDLSLEG